MIESYLWEQLAALYSSGTLSSAAEKLHLSQPSLSRSMKKLEDVLGVSLFERQKNRITLNETGALAARYAMRLMEEEEEMVKQIRLFDRSLRTFSVGSCAPGPLMELLPRVTAAFPELSVSSAVAGVEQLMQGLASNEYTAVILPFAVDDPALLCQRYMSEKLNLSVSRLHPAAVFQTISFEQMNGQNFIMYAHVGVWESIVREKMPQSRFFLQNDADAVGELARHSELPSFTTDITIAKMASRQNGRINIPFSDPEATVTYYIVCRKEEKRIARLLQMDTPPI